MPPGKGQVQGGRKWKLNAPKTKTWHFGSIAADTFCIQRTVLRPLSRYKSGMSEYFRILKFSADSFLVSCGHSLSFL